MVQLAQLNLNGPWPMKGPFTTIFCRNVMIYFNRDVRERLVRRYHDMLEPGGYLFIGRAESLTDSALIREMLSRLSSSVDVLFRSVAEQVGDAAIGVILTGMGADGAQGLLEMHKRGARTLAQDEKSCVVYGMPRAAVELGAVDEVLSLHELASTLSRLSWPARRMAG